MNNLLAIDNLLDKRKGQSHSNSSYLDFQTVITGGCIGVKDDDSEARG